MPDIGKSAVAEVDAGRIADVLLAYATAIDTKDWVLFERQFTPDCTMTSPGTTIVGASALAKHMRVLHEPLDASLHRVTNIDVTVEGDQAASHSYLDALLVRADHAGGTHFHVVGTYTDQLRRVDGAWLIQRRDFRAVWREGNALVLGGPVG